MNTGVIGWVWVAGQAVLLGALILLPGGETWSTPLIVRTIANVLFFGGVLLAVIAGTRLGSALTPTPVPTKAGSLATTGLYRYVRHPIYSGVLMIVAGIGKLHGKNSSSSFDIPPMRPMRQQRRGSSHFQGDAHSVHHPRESFVTVAMPGH